MRRLFLALVLVSFTGCASIGGSAPPATASTQAYEVLNSYRASLEVADAAVHDERVPANVRSVIRTAVAEASPHMRALREAAQSGNQTQMSLGLSVARSALDRLDRALSSNNIRRT